MNFRRVLLLVGTLCLSIGFLSVSFALAGPGGPEDPPGPDLESQAEAEKALAAEQSPGPARVVYAGAGGVNAPLFVGVDDPTVPAYRINVSNNISFTAFVGVDVWGSAYDIQNDRVLFNDGSTLWEWPIGGVPNSLGTMTLNGGVAVLVGLAYHDGVLYGTRNIAPENLFSIDTNTLVVTTAITLTVDPVTIDLGGIAADPASGQLYAANDSANELVAVNPDGSVTPVAPYPSGQTDIDGLAVGDGRAYLVTDEPGDIYIFDFGVMTYTGSLVNPWTTSETFAGGAWIPVLPDIAVSPASLSSTHSLPQVVTQTLSISNTGGAILDWTIVEESPAPFLPGGLSATEFERGIHPPSAGPAPAGVVAPQSHPQVAQVPLGTSAYGWNSQNGPYYTRFNPDFPEILLNVAPFDPSGNFIGAGVFHNDKVYMIDGANNMWEVDPETGGILNTYVATAPDSGESYSGLTVDPTTGQAYAASTNVSTSTLMTIDLLTGVATPVGPISNAPALIALAADGSGDLYGYDILTDLLLSIDKATGAGTEIGSIGFDANFGQGMEYDPATGTIYMAAFNASEFRAELRAVNTMTGDTGLFGVLGEGNPGGLNQLGWLGFGQPCLSADIPWLNVSPTSGSTAGGEADSVNVTFDSDGLPPGLYSGNLCIDSTDPDEAQLRVPVMLNVTVKPVYLPIIVKE